VGVYKLDNRHSAEQEEQNAGDLTQMLNQLVRYDFFIAMAEDKDRPADDAGEHCASGLVDLYWMFKRDGCISDDEGNEDRKFHFL
jgi:hypothetical protein